jgi:microcystin-dependent protein
MSDPFVGEIRMVGFNFAPEGWALCNGQLMSISQNTALFSLLGTFYGGDGVSTFALPNLQGRVPVHQGTGAGLPTYSVGEVAGAPTITLTTSQLPAHTHSLAANTAPAVSDVPTGAALASSPAFTTSSPNTTLSATSIGTAGSGVPVSIVPPLLCINFVIALQGIFPARN